MVDQYQKLEIGCEAMLGRLGTIRKDMAQAQDGKLIKLWNEKGDYKDAPLGAIIEKLKEELGELHEALRQYGPCDIKDEILDVRNVTEFLWDLLELSSLCAALRRDQE